MFLANPAPICVLDEVDAPLDDANVDRFCNMLDEMRRRTETRFIAITHNPVTMAGWTACSASPWPSAASRSWSGRPAPGRGAWRRSSGTKLCPGRGPCCDVTNPALDALARPSIGSAAIWPGLSHRPHSHRSHHAACRRTARRGATPPQRTGRRLGGTDSTSWRRDRTRANRRSARPTESSPS